MKKHEKFLQFNGQNIVFLNADGQYWVALKPILQALNLESGRYMKRTQRDPFFSTCVDNMSIQVGKNGQIQSRIMTCLPEKYIYGWICFLNGDNPELNDYKKTCYELLYNHFHGTITSRKELLLQRNEVDTEIYKLKENLKQKDDEYKSMKRLELKRKSISAQLNNMDSELIKEPRLFPNNEGE